MIYKCNNCGRNFNLKPDFCDCGNNTFVEVVENFDYSTVKTDFNVGKDVDFLYNQNNFSANNEESSQNENTYEDDLKKQRTSEVIAIVVFAVVLITAAIMIFSNFSALMKKSNVKTATAEIETYIPSDVNEYWKDSETSTETNNSARQNNNTNNNNTNSVNKNNIKSDKTQSVAKTTVSKNISKSQTKKQEKNQTTTKNNNKTKNPEQKTQIVAKNKNITQTSASADDNTISVEEYLCYKNSLRNRLFANFPVLTVKGQGTAKIAFSVASDGKLTNRRFISQSGNKTLDDAMYHMLMRVPVFSAPPTGFEGREIMMQMDFNNGHYSFAFIN